MRLPANIKMVGTVTGKGRRVKIELTYACGHTITDYRSAQIGEGGLATLGKAADAVGCGQCWWPTEQDLVDRFHEEDV